MPTVWPRPSRIRFVAEIEQAAKETGERGPERGPLQGLLGVHDVRGRVQHPVASSTQMMAMKMIQIKGAGFGEQNARRCDAVPYIGATDMADDKDTVRIDKWLWPRASSRAAPSRARS